MNRFWNRYTGPLIRELMPRRILEIGAEAGLDTRYLLMHCRDTGCHLDIIETLPSPELTDLLGQFGSEVCTLHVGKSTDLIGSIAAPDIVMLDGDHNWQTVYTELSLFRRRALADGQPIPLILAHDCAWPYGRRDMYYNPDDFDDSQRRPYAYKGIMPGVSELVDNGMNGWYANALEEGGPENGVLTAIEDFVTASGDIRLWVLPFFNGLGIIVPDARRTAGLEALIESFYSPDMLIETCKALEEDGMKMRAALYEERRRLEIRTDALQRARRLLNERNARISELEASLKEKAHG